MQNVQFMQYTIKRIDIQLVKIARKLLILQNNYALH